MNESLDVVCGPDGVMRDIHDRPMVVIFKSRPTRRKKTKPKEESTDNGPESTRPLVFVDVSNSKGTANIDLRRKKEIRTHVMRDYWRREKEKFLEKDRNSKPQNETASTQLADEDGSLGNSTIPRLQYKGMDPFVKYPVQMHPIMHKLLHYYVTVVVYTSDSRAPRGKARSLPGSELYSLALTDAAPFYMVLCSAATYMNMITGTTGSGESERYKLEAIHLLNQRLRDPNQAVSDVVIAAVTSLAIIECVAGNHAEWALHMNGLSRMIHIRGGLASLCRSLRVKISRADIIGSVETDSKPRFPYLDYNGQEVRLTSAKGANAPQLAVGFATLIRTFDFELDFVNILEDLQGLLDNANRTSATTTSNRPPRMDSAVTMICYRFLSYAPDVDTTRHDPRELCRLGAQIYLQTLVYGFPSCRIFCALLVRKLQIYLDCIDRTTGGKKVSNEFIIWLMFIGGIITQEKSTKSWFVARLSHATGQLQLNSWNGVKATLMKFFWIDTIHAQPCKDLWDEVIYYLTLNQR